MQLGGKREGQPLVATAAGQNNGLLLITDSSSKRQFLVDTGAEISVLPATGLEKRAKQLGPALLVANGSSIRTYSTRTLSLVFARNTYTREFTIAEVSRPLLGADFFRSSSLLVDLGGKRLVDAATYHSVPLDQTTCAYPMPHLDSLSGSANRYDKLLTDFPDITTPNFIQSQNKHGVEHFIPPIVPPIHARARRLPPDKLAATKAELKEWKRWASYIDRPARGHHRSRWCRNLPGVGGRAEITDA